MLARLARSRLVWFVVLGGLFWGMETRKKSRVVDLDPAALRALHEAQAKRLGVPALGEDGRREVDARAIEDEILYREALRLELDRDDPIVRQRLVQKLLLLVEDLGGASRDPSPEDLRAHYEATRERWRRPERHRFVFAFARDRAGLPASIGTTPPDAGDPFPYPREMTATRDAGERLLGREAADAIASLPVLGTSEPVPSPFGWHRFRVLDRIDDGIAPLASVEKAVTLDFLLSRRERVVGAWLEKTAATYDVRVGGQAAARFVPTRRTAERYESSAED